MKQTPGSIGFVELICALTGKLPMGAVQNAAGRFIAPTLASVTTAAASLKDVPDDFRVSITNPSGAGAYPVAGFTWLLVPVGWKDSGKKQAIVQFLNWMIDNGGSMAPSMNYAPLPSSVAAKIRQEVRQIK